MRVINTLRLALANRLFRGLAQQPLASTVPTPEAPLEQQPPALARPGWYALPGSRMEYRDSGMVIVQASRPKQAAYTLIDPDGQMLATAHPGLLAQLQMHAELVAAERATFVYHPAHKDAHG